MKSVASVRRALKVKTLFNMMGPIINPSFPKNQLVGVSDLEIMKLYHQVFVESDQHYMIVHSLDGYDEISLTGAARFISNDKEDRLLPADFGFSQVTADELYGGQTVAEAAAIFQQVLEVEASEAQQNVVIANAALGIKCIYPETSMEDCVARANDSLKSKRALAAFKKLMEINKK